LLIDLVLLFPLCSVYLYSYSYAVPKTLEANVNTSVDTLETLEGQIHTVGLSKNDINKQMCLEFWVVL